LAKPGIALEHSANDLDWKAEETSRGVPSMKNAALLIIGLAALAANAWAGDEAQFERVQYDAWYNSLRDAAVAYDHKDYPGAFVLYRHAACAGDKTSQSILGRMYLLGQTPARDDLTGYAWIKLSAEFNFAEFTSLARKLEGSQTPQVREKGNARADELRRLYGLAATNMSCHGESRRGGYVIDSVVCTPHNASGGEFQLRRCVDDAGANPP
jgi:TPR repeat protein